MIEEVWGGERGLNSDRKRISSLVSLGYGTFIPFVFCKVLSDFGWGFEEVPAYIPVIGFAVLWAVFINWDNMVFIEETQIRVIRFFRSRYVPFSEVYDVYEIRGTNFKSIIVRYKDGSQEKSFKFLTPLELFGRKVEEHSPTFNMLQKKVLLSRHQRNDGR